MKHNRTAKNNHARLALGFSQLCESDQLYLENLTVQLAKIHTTAPETRRLSVKSGKGAVVTKRSITIAPCPL